jgi:hypothetical protein
MHTCTSGLDQSSYKRVLLTSGKGVCILTREIINHHPVGSNLERSILELKVGLVQRKDEPCLLVLPSPSSGTCDALLAYHM